MIESICLQNEWVPNKAGVKRELLDTVKAMKLAYYGHTMRKQVSCLEKEIMLPPSIGCFYFLVFLFYNF